MNTTKHCLRRARIFDEVNAVHAVQNYCVSTNLNVITQIAIYK